MFACVINLGTHQFRWSQNASKLNIAPNLQRYSESSNPCECPKTWDCDRRHASRHEGPTEISQINCEKLKSEEI